MRPFHDSLDLETPIISYNGAKVVYNESEIYETALPTAVVQSLVSISREQHVHLNLYSDEVWYTERPESDESRDYAEKAHLEPVGKDLSLIASDQCTKALFIAPPDRLASLSPLLSERLGAEVELTSSMSHFLEVLTYGVNKGAAIKSVCQRLNIPLSETIAFGDGLNDLEMIKLVEHGVAMENGHPTLKAQADAIAPHHDKGGVATYLTRYLNLV